MSETSEIVRQIFGRADAECDRELTKPEDIIRHDNILYGNDKKESDRCLPPKAAKDESVLVIVCVRGFTGIKRSIELGLLV